MTIRARLREDQGMALASVVALMAVTAIISVSILASVLSAMSYTSSTRASVQSRAAADGGVNFAAASIHNGECQSIYRKTYADFDATAADKPFFDASVQWRAGESGSWMNGCPTGMLAASGSYQVRIESTGYAQQVGVQGATSGDQTTVEAIFAWTLDATESEAIPATGAAVYSYAAPSNTVNGLTLNSVGEHIASIQYRTGDYSCVSSSIDGDVTVANGKATVDSGCTVKGSLYASGAVVMNANGRVNGSVTAGSTSSAWPSSGSAFYQGNSSNYVGGSVIANGGANMRGTVIGSLLSGPTVSESVFTSTARIGGSLTTAGTVKADWCGGNCPSPAQHAATIDTAVVAGAVTTGATGIAQPQTPNVPGWADYTFDAADWVGEDGTAFQLVTLSAAVNGECNWSWDASPGIAKLKAALASTVPTVIDARACGNLSMYTVINPKLNSDLVIIVNGFSGGSNVWSSQSGQPHRLWIVTPDLVDDDKPGSSSCPSGSTGIVFSQGFKVESPLSASVYTPCAVENSSTSWVGQMYAGKVTMHGSITLDYTPNGMPGLNLNTGEDIDSGGASLTPAGGTLGDMQLYRDLSEPSTSVIAG